MRDLAEAYPPRKVRVSDRMEGAGKTGRNKLFLLIMADCLPHAVQDDEIVHVNSTGIEMTVI